MSEPSPSPISAITGETRTSATVQWGRPWIVLLVFVVLGFGIYSPCLNGGRIWDDHYLVGENPFFRSPVFSLEVFRQHLFSESFSTYYRPVQNLSYMLDYWLWGESLAGYHCANVLIHTLAAWFLFLLLRRLVPGLWKGGGDTAIASLLVALVWLVHPVHNAAVAYVSGRADSLAVLFAIGGWLAWIASRDSSGVSRAICWISAALLFLAALCSKEIALVWGMLFGLHTLIFERSARWRCRMLSVAGLLAVIAAYAVLHSLPGHRASMPGALPEPFSGRVILALRALGDYCGLMLVPVRLMMERSLGHGDMYANRSAWWRGIGSEYLSIVGVVVLVALAWLCMRRGEARSLRRFGALWFLVALVPISNLIPLNAEVAEHWIYTASIGFLLLSVGAVAMLPAKIRRMAVSLSFAAAVALAARTGFRAADWADGETFASRTIASGGGSARLLVYYANELGRKGRLAEQEMVYRKTLAVCPGFMTARISLGVCLQKQGRTEEAGPLLDIGSAGTVVSDVPRTWNAALNVAGQLHKDGRSVDALALLREWKTLNPDTWELAGCEANVLRETVGPKAALGVVGKYAREHWWHLPSQLGLASLQREVGDYALALETARNAQRLDIRGGAAYYEAAKCEIGLGRVSDALESQAVAVSRASKNPAYLDFFSAILHQLGRDGEAMAAHRRSEALAVAEAKRLL